MIVVYGGMVRAATGTRAVALALGAALQRERRREELLLFEDRYRMMVERGPAVTYIDAVDDAASTVYISPQVEELLGFTPQEWLEDPELWPRILHPDDRARALAENERTTRRGSVSGLSTGCSPRTGGSSGCTTRPRSCATSAASPATATA
ncbi:MAG: PAS domain-containing protein [Candidatus Rokubacteria bacterium]|nr:PAS domain-containing protein [Candidatus Rokubacteria bacterium]